MSENKMLSMQEAHDAKMLELTFNEIKHASQRILRAQIASKNTSAEYKKACEIELKGRAELRAALEAAKAPKVEVIEVAAVEIKTKKAGK